VIEEYLIDVLVMDVDWFFCDCFRYDGEELFFLCLNFMVLYSFWVG